MSRDSGTLKHSFSLMGYVHEQTGRVTVPVELFKDGLDFRNVQQVVKPAVIVSHGLFLFVANVS